MVNDSNSVLFVDLSRRKGTKSARLSIKAAKQAIMNPKTQRPKENIRGLPRFWVFSKIKGVKKLLKAFPSSGKVMPMPSAKACSVP